MRMNLKYTETFSKILIKCMCETIVSQRKASVIQAVKLYVIYLLTRSNVKSHHTNIDDFMIFWMMPMQPLWKNAFVHKSKKTMAMLMVRA